VQREVNQGRRNKMEFGICGDLGAARTEKLALEAEDLVIMQYFSQIISDEDMTRG